MTNQPVPEQPAAPVAYIIEAGLRVAIRDELIRHHYEIDIVHTAFTPYCRCNMPVTRGLVNTDAEWADHVATDIISAMLAYQEKSREKPEGKDPDGPR